MDLASELVGSALIGSRSAVRCGMQLVLPNRNISPSQLPAKRVQYKSPYRTHRGGHDCVMGYLEKSCNLLVMKGDPESAFLTLGCDGEYRHADLLRTVLYS